MEPEKAMLTEEERKLVRKNTVHKKISYFEDRNNRSCTHGNLFTRRRNLTEHFGVDHSVGVEEVQEINKCALPLNVSPVQSQEELLPLALRYKCLPN